MTSQFFSPNHHPTVVRRGFRRGPGAAGAAGACPPPAAARAPAPLAPPCPRASCPRAHTTGDQGGHVQPDPRGAGQSEPEQPGADCGDGARPQGPGLQRHHRLQVNSWALPAAFCCSCRMLPHSASCAGPSAGAPVGVDRLGLLLPPSPACRSLRGVVRRQPRWAHAGRELPPAAAAALDSVAAARGDGLPPSDNPLPPPLALAPVLTPPHPRSPARPPQRRRGRGVPAPAPVRAPRQPGAEAGAGGGGAGAPDAVL